MWYYITHPKLIWLFVITGIFILFGIIVFSTLEGWSTIDSFYFTVSTITTVGYGDFTPTTSAAKLFASFYMMLTVPLILFSVGFSQEIAHDKINEKRKKKK